MKRRDFIQSTAIAGAGLTTTLQACKTTEPMKGIVHYVLFWLREDLSDQEITDFTQFFEELRPIPEIKYLTYGKPAATNPRDVVDNTFSYNLIVIFDHLDQTNTYENHPLHTDAVSRYSKYWTKVVVHDSIV